MTITRNELLNRITDFLRDHAENDLGNFGEDSQLLADLGFNSLDLMTIVNDAETEFNIVIEDEDMDKIVTVGDVVDLIASKTEE